MTIGQRIESERKRNNLTMEELGSKLGVGRSAVNKWEKGIVSEIKLQYISEMSKIFGCDPAWLSGFSQKKQQSRGLKMNNMTDRQMVDKVKLDKALYERFHEENSVNNITVVALGEVRKFIQDFHPQEDK